LYSCVVLYKLQNVRAVGMLLSRCGKHALAKMKLSLVIDYSRKLTIGVSFEVSVKMK
jgi:hypothetical protein